MALSPNAARVVTEQNRAAQSFGRYTYPSTPGVHNIVLHFRKYSFNGTLGNVSPSIGANSIGSVVLPLPSNIEDTYSIQVNQFEMGSAGALAADFLSGNGRAVAEDVTNFLKDGLGEGMSPGSILSNIKAGSAFFGRNALDALGIGGLSGAVDVTSGTALNPHVALRFEGVNLKNHEFLWTLSPKNEAEAASIRDMINFIRSKILPTYNNGNGDSAISRALLDYPSLVDIYFVGVDQSYLYYFKPAMVSSFKTNYSPNGLAFNRGGRPAVIQMSMSLTEARIHTADDVNTGGGSYAPPTSSGQGPF
jgi:hypothetical protein